MADILGIIARKTENKPIDEKKATAQIHMLGKEKNNRWTADKENNGRSQSKLEGFPMNVKNLIKQIYWWAIQTRFFNKFRHRLIKTRYFLLRGKTKRTNSDLSILVFASYENIPHYLAKLAYFEEPQIKILGDTTYHKIPKIIAETKPDMAFAEFSWEMFSRFFLSNKFLLVPRVTHTLDISPPWEIIFARMRPIRRRNIRKIEKLPYTYEVTKDPNKFNFFYHEMYSPFVSKTPDDIARSTSVAVAREWFLKGEILFVKSNNTYLSGILYHPENHAIHCRMVAYNEGIACQAALYTVIRRAKEQGCTEINYGDTSPFMSDGLFYYKRSWGMKIQPHLKIVLTVKLCNFRKGVQDFLINNPFIFTDLKDSIGVVLLDSNNIDQNSLNSKYYSPGLSKLMVFYPKKSTLIDRISDSTDSSAPTLGSVDFLIKLASEMNFDVYLHDFPTQ